VKGLRAEMAVLNNNDSLLGFIAPFFPFPEGGHSLSKDDD